MTERDRTSGARPALLIIGFAFVLLMMVAVVVDSSAAYLQRQGLDTLADGAALAGADAGARGSEAYGGGLGDELRLDAAAARAAVADYLRRVGAYDALPGPDRPGLGRPHLATRPGLGPRPGPTCRSTSPARRRRHRSAPTSAATVGVD